jgi:hypothetical protein
MHGHIVAAANFLCAIFVPWMSLDLPSFYWTNNVGRQNENAITWTVLDEAENAVGGGLAGTQPT